MEPFNFKTITFVTLFFVFSQGHAQTANYLKPRFQKEIIGDVVIIANSITNRVDYGNTSNTPYYNHTSSANLNDDFFMEYIDIDEDNSTFSSSSAELFFESNSAKKIVYAGLYWAGTYKYNRGEELKVDKFTPVDPKREAVNTIKIKLPNQTEYKNITGSILYDGINTPELKDYAPYVVYADITDEITSLSNPTGVYTVANVRATQGTLKGGVASGWKLFLVYEDSTKSKKHITTYDGFSDVSSESVLLNFNGFQTLASGQVNAQVAVAALDGDYKVAGDKVLIKTANQKDFIALSNKLRKPDNFFNSSITLENKHFINRFPDSKNTLGFDSCLFTIPNVNNTIFGNNTTNASLKIESSSDKCFLFFTSLVVEESLTPIVEKKQTTLVAEDILDHYEVRKVSLIKEMFADLNQTTSAKNLSQKNKTLANKTVDTKKEIIEIQTINITNQEKGFYVVANAFTVPINAKQFVAMQSLKAVEGKTFVNKINNYTYVYLDRFNNLEDAIRYYNSKAGGIYTDPLYIVSVNNEVAGITDSD